MVELEGFRREEETSYMWVDWVDSLGVIETGCNNSNADRGTALVYLVPLTCLPFVSSFTGLSTMELLEKPA